MAPNALMRDILRDSLRDRDLARQMVRGHHQQLGLLEGKPAGVLTPHQVAHRRAQFQTGTGIDDALEALAVFGPVARDALPGAGRQNTVEILELAAVEQTARTVFSHVRLRDLDDGPAFQDADDKTALVPAGQVNILGILNPADPGPGIKHRIPDAVPGLFAHAPSSCSL